MFDPSSEKGANTIYTDLFPKAKDEADERHTDGVTGWANLEQDPIDGFNANNVTWYNMTTRQALINKMQFSKHMVNQEVTNYADKGLEPTLIFTIECIGFKADRNN